MMTVVPRRGAAILLVQIALCAAVLLPVAIQSLAIVTLHLPDTHSQQSHRAPGLTTMSESGLIAIASTLPVSALDTQDITSAATQRPAARPVEPPEYPPR